MGEPTFRPMTEADVEAVLKIEFSAFSHPWTRGIFLDCIKSGYECWLMFLGDQQVGHGVLSAAGDECHLLNLTVKPESQSNGLGGKLLDHLLLQGRQRGRSEEHTSELQSRPHLVCRLLLEKKKKNKRKKKRVQRIYRTQ